VAAAELAAATWRQRDAANNGEDGRDGDLGEKPAENMGKILGKHMEMIKTVGFQLIYM
jgi:hypothetical protein